MKIALVMCFIFLALASFGVWIPDDSFIEAVKDNDLRRVERHLSWYKHSDLKITHIIDTNDKTALHWAAELGHLKIAQLLVDYDPDILLSMDWSNFSAMHYAADSGHLELVKYLAEKAPKLVTKRSKKIAYRPYMQDEADYTPLHFAAHQGHEEVVKFLVGKGANPNDTSYSSKTPLSLAAEQGHFEIVKYLFNHVMHKNSFASSRFGTLVSILSSANRADILEYLFAQTEEHDRSQFFKTMHEGLALAAEAGFIEIVKIILKNEPALAKYAENKNFCALHRASKKGHLEIVRLLVNYGADIDLKDSRKRTALHYAIVHNFPAIERFLHAKNISRDGMNAAITHRAIKDGDVELFSSMLIRSSSLYEEYKEYFPFKTLLGSAIAYNRLAMVKLLQEYDPNFANEKAGSFLDAARLGKKDILEYLLEQDIDVNMQGGYGDTALHEAAQYCRLECAAFLLEKGADKEKKNSIGQTPLQRAIKGILPHSTKLKAKDPEGWKALVHAYAANKAKMVEYLLGKGADKLSVDSKNESILQSIVYGFDFNSMRQFVEKYFFRDEDFYASNPHYAFADAAMKGELSKLKLLEDRGAINRYWDKNTFALLWAAEGGHSEAVEYLLEKGFDSAARDPRNNTTALQKALSFHRIATVEKLLARSDKADKSEALFIATNKKYFFLMRRLIIAHADVNAVLENGQSILHTAILHGDVELVKFLLRKGAAIDQADNDGNTALHYAAKSESAAMVRFFLGKGFDANQANYKGESPQALVSPYSRKADKLITLLKKSLERIDADEE